MEVSAWAEPTPNGDEPVPWGQRAASEGRYREALEAFLVEIQSGQRRDEAREAMLKVFAVLGDDDPLTAEYRRKLAMALY
jgi:putative thioredoxin